MHKNRELTGNRSADSRQLSVASKNQFSPQSHGYAEKLSNRIPESGFLVFLTVPNRLTIAFGNSRARQSKKLPYKFIKFMLLCSFMSLEYELVVFDKFIKFIKFISAWQICNEKDPSATLGISPAGSDAC